MMINKIVSALVIRCVNSINVWTTKISGIILLPLQVGQCDPHPAPEPVARTNAPKTITKTLYPKTTQANFANFDKRDIFSPIFLT
jgi:hypothetical protein